MHFIQVYFDIHFVNLDLFHSIVRINLFFEQINQHYMRYEYLHQFRELYLN